MDGRARTLQSLRERSHGQPELVGALSQRLRQGLIRAKLEGLLRKERLPFSTFRRGHAKMNTAALDCPLNGDILLFDRPTCQWPR